MPGTSRHLSLVGLTLELLGHTYLSDHVSPDDPVVPDDAPAAVNGDYLEPTDGSNGTTVLGLDGSPTSISPLDIVQ